MESDFSQQRIERSNMLFDLLSSMVADSDFEEKEIEKLNRLFENVLDRTLVGYLDEAKRCLLMNANRAAVVLTWCAIVHHLYKQVEMSGYDFFERVYHKKYPNQPPRHIENIIDLRDIKDFHLLRVIQEMGILRSEERFHALDSFRELRNDCAHGVPRNLTSREIMFQFEKLETFFGENPGIDENYNSVRYVVDFLSDDKYELSVARARGLILGLHTEDLIVLSQELINYFFRSDINLKQRERARLVFTEITPDKNQRIEINRRLARAMERNPEISQISVRKLIYWQEMEDIGQIYYKKIIYHLFDEMQVIVREGNTTEEDVNILEVLTKLSTGPTHDDYRILYQAARKQIFKEEES